MADDPLADPPPVTNLIWSPLVRDGRVRIGMAARQWVPLAVLASGTGVVALLVLWPSAQRAVAAGAVFVVSMGCALVFFNRVGIELIGGEVIVRRGFGRYRSMATDEIVAVEVVADGHVVFELRDGDAVSALAPRRTDNLVDDPMLQDKVALIRLWIRDGGASALQALSLPRITREGDATARSPSAIAAKSLDREDIPDHRSGYSTENGPARFPLATLVVLFGLAVVIGYLFVGRDVLVLAIAVLVLLRFGRDPGRPLALAAFLLLIIAAVASIVQEMPPLLVTNYANRRPTATEAGAIVGVFMVLATFIFAGTERAAERARWRPVVDLRAFSNEKGISATAASAWQWALLAWPFGAASLLAAVIRMVGSPAAVPAIYAPLLDNLRLGTGYSMAVPTGAVPFADAPPLATVLVAYFPFGAGVSLLMVGMSTVAIIGGYSHRMWGRNTAVVSMAVAAVLPSLWAQQLAIQLAGLLVLCGVALADPVLRIPSTGRALAGGVCLGGAVLARPDSIVALAVVAIWILANRPMPWRQVVAMTAGAFAVIAPWLNFVWSEFGFPWPASTLGTVLNDTQATSRLGFVGFAVGAAVVVVTLAALRELLDRERQLLPFFALPLVGAAMAVTDLGHRDALGWAAPLAAIVIGRWLAQRWRGPLRTVLG